MCFGGPEGVRTVVSEKQQKRQRQSGSESHERIECRRNERVYVVALSGEIRRHVCQQSEQRTKKLAPGRVGELPNDQNNKTRRSGF